MLTKKAKHGFFINSPRSVRLGIKKTPPLRRGKEFFNDDMRLLIADFFCRNYILESCSALSLFLFIIRIEFRIQIVLEYPG